MTAPDRPAPEWCSKHRTYHGSPYGKASNCPDAMTAPESCGCVIHSTEDEWRGSERCLYPATLEALKVAQRFGQEAHARAEHYEAVAQRHVHAVERLRIAEEALEKIATVPQDHTGQFYAGIAREALERIGGKK